MKPVRGSDGDKDDGDYGYCVVWVVSECDDVGDLHWLTRGVLMDLVHWHSEQVVEVQNRDRLRRTCREDCERRGGNCIASRAGSDW